MKRPIHCPYKYKYELVAWAAKHFQKSKTHFKKHSKKQLYAMYYKEARLCEKI